MAVTFYVDWGMTINLGYSSTSPEYNRPLLDKLKEFHDNGNRIVMATDGENYIAQYCVKKMRESGYDIIDDVIAVDTFGIKKTDSRYWPRVGEKGKAVLIDDYDEALGNARRHGIEPVDSTAPDMLTNLDATYQRLTLDQ